MTVSIARGALWNLAGFGLPLLAALIAVPPILHAIGAERFGILAIAWAIIGAASVLDLGMGRALTRLVAKSRAESDTAELPSLVLSAIAMLCALGLAGAVILAAIAPFLVVNFLHVDARYVGQAERAIAVLAIGLPFVLSSAALQGVLEGYLRFDLSNLVRIPISALNYLAAFAVLGFTTDLAWIVGAMVLTRILGCATYAVLVVRLMREGSARARLMPRILAPLLAFGGWMTVSTIIATLIVYLDRFVIASFSSMQEVTFYATPYEVITRLSLLPGAVSVALLPAFSAAVAESRERVEQFFAAGLRYVVLLVFPAALLVVLFAREGLALWVGDDIAVHSAGVARLLAAGIFVNGLAFIPFTFLYSAGRPDIVAKLHLVELPVYALVLWQLVMRFGAEGAAAAWALRVAADAVLLFIAARRLFPALDLRYARVALVSCAALAVLAVGGALPNGAVRLGYGLAVLSGFAALGWSRLLTRAERVALGRTVARRP